MQLRPIFNMQHTEAYQLWQIIQDLKDRFLNESDFVERRKLYKRLQKYERMYDKCVTEEAHREIIINGELRTRGY